MDFENASSDESDAESLGDLGPGGAAGGNRQRGFSAAAGPAAVGSERIGASVSTVCDDGIRSCQNVGGRCWFMATMTFLKQTAFAYSAPEIMADFLVAEALAFADSVTACTTMLSEGAFDRQAYSAAVCQQAPDIVLREYNRLNRRVTNLEGLFEVTLQNVVTNTRMARTFFSDVYLWAGSGVDDLRLSVVSRRGLPPPDSVDPRFVVVINPLFQQHMPYTLEKARIREDQEPGFYSYVTLAVTSASTVLPRFDALSSTEITFVAMGLFDTGIVDHASFSGLVPNFLPETVGRSFADGDSFSYVKDFADVTQLVSANGGAGLAFVADPSSACFSSSADDLGGDVHFECSYAVSVGDLARESVQEGGYPEILVCAILGIPLAIDYEPPPPPGADSKPFWRTKTRGFESLEEFGANAHVFYTASKMTKHGFFAVKFAADAFRFWVEPTPDGESDDIAFIRAFLGHPKLAMWNLELLGGFLSVKLPGRRGFHAVSFSWCYDDETQSMRPLYCDPNRLNCSTENEWFIIGVFVDVTFILRDPTGKPPATWQTHRKAVLKEAADRLFGESDYLESELEDVDVGPHSDFNSDSDSGGAAAAPERSALAKAFEDSSESESDFDVKNIDSGGGNAGTVPKYGSSALAEVFGSDSDSDSDSGGGLAPAPAPQTSAGASRMADAFKPNFDPSAQTVEMADSEYENFIVPSSNDSDSDMESDPFGGARGYDFGSGSGSGSGGAGQAPYRLIAPSSSSDSYESDSENPFLRQRGPLDPNRNVRVRRRRRQGGGDRSRQRLAAAFVDMVVCG